MKLIVTGAAGWIGREVSRRAGAEGCRVVAVDTAADAPGPWSYLRTADISTDEVLQLAGDPLLQGATAIVHCAGLAHRPREAAVDIPRFEAVNAAGTRRVVELAHRLGCDRIVYLSSIAFYDWQRGCDFDEEGPLAPTTAYARSKLAGEQTGRDSGLDFRVARLGTVFGAGDRANFAKLASALSRGRFVVPGAGTARKSVLPVGLAGQLLVDLALRPRVEHRVLNLALPMPVSLAEITESFARICGFPRPKRGPYWLLAGLGRLGDLAAQFRPGFPVTTENLRKLTRSTSVRTTRMTDTWPNGRWPSFAEVLAEDETRRYYSALSSTRRSPASKKSDG